MKSLLLCCLGAAGFCLAQEPVVLPLELGTFKTVDNKVYEGAKIIGSDAVGIKLMHEGGTARITYDRLPRELAARFKVDAGAAKAQLEKEAAEADQHQRMTAMAEPVSEEDGSKTDLPDGNGKSEDQRIAELQTYIYKMKATIVRMDEEIVKKLKRADSLTLAAYPNASDSKRGANLSILQRAMAMREEAKQDGIRILDIKALIKKAELEVRRLQHPNH